MWWRETRFSRIFEEDEWSFIWHVKVTVGSLLEVHGDYSNMGRTWSTLKDRVAQANQWGMEGSGTTQLEVKLRLLPSFTCTLFGTSLRSKGSCFPLGLSFKKTLQSTRGTWGSLTMYPHCEYGITVNMDTYSWNVLLYIKLWRYDADMMRRLFSKGSYQGPRQSISVFQFLFDKSLTKDLWNREMHLFSIRIGGQCKRSIKSCGRRWYTMVG